MRNEVTKTGLTFAGEMTPMTEVKGIVIHHTGADDIDASAADIHQWHLANGWAGIGYHKVFRKAGDVERGRPEEFQGAHCPGANSFTLGYHICGSFGGQLPNEAQIQAIVATAADDCGKYGLDPLGMLPNGKDVISGHRDWLATECPGEMLYSFIPQIRQMVAEAMQQGAG
jgi:N-acetylmuramoyl-L-alanine amidase